MSIERNTINKLLDLIDAIDEAELKTLDRFEFGHPHFQQDMANLHPLSEAIMEAKDYAEKTREAMEILG